MINSLYGINRAYENALNNFTVDEETGEIIFNDDEIKKLEDDYKTKVDNIVCYIKELQVLSDAIKAEKTALDERLKANDKMIDTLKKYVANSLEMRDINKLETARNKLSFRKSTSVVIADETSVPSQYIKTVLTEKIDKKAIGDALKKGEIINGCYLKESNNLQIK